jgi:hypothetical protein
VPGASLQLSLNDALEAVSKLSFGPNVFVGASFKIFEILMYSCGFQLGPAATLNQNPNFETASTNNYPNSKVSLL